MRNFSKTKYFKHLFIIFVCIQIIGFIYLYGLAPFKIVKNLSDIHLYDSCDIYTKLPDNKDIKEFFQDKIIADIPNIEKMTEFDKQIALRKWIRNSLTNLSVPTSTENNNLIILYQELREGISSATCGQLSLLYAYALDSFQQKFRIVSLIRDMNIFNRSSEDSHVVIEIWSNEYNKWYISDPTFNGYFVDKDGIPMNALEIREAIYETREELKGTGISNLAYANKIKFERNGTKEEPTLLSYYIDPFLIYDDIFIKGGQLYNNQGFLDKIKLVFERIYRKSSVSYYLVDEYHPPLILDKIYIYLFFINPVLIFITLIMLLYRYSGYKKSKFKRI